MSDIKSLLAAEAEKLRPAYEPEFAELLAERTKRRRRYAAVAASAVAVVLVVGSAQLTQGPGPRDRQPADIRKPLPAGGVMDVTVTGMMRMVGGPLGSGPSGVAGKVHFGSADGSVTSAEVSTEGRFSVALPAGRYTVTGTPISAESPICQARDEVVVPAGGLSGVEVDCHIR
ncbi:hypothetical protein Q0Z83_046230 [Actinoplanes sichuanensis]|uniref:Carboxypeptidase regulatory-like domain-containing protein n=1 Tax=Actinoplanes sichuanensis TaxID=512349 RepID=A0ABW4A9V7_9ACTN|nr:hypothetical protein [Actinoplanes sichuanensis]BEL06432.1 hypothetical protein Q0Z83_046230 [Actinoplanes sichuanensis]